MSGFRVEPEALRAYARDLADARAAAEAAKAYVAKWGSFSAHDKGLLGMIWPNHANYVAQLDQLLTHLAALTDASSGAMKQQAEHYETTDIAAERAVDDSYPAVPRQPISRD